jgi:YHS domain-containing protein
MRTLILLGLGALPFLGCSNTSPPDCWQSRGDRVLGIGSDSAEDPVSGAVVAKNNAVKSDFRGTTYYFASSKTAGTFLRNPEEYALQECEETDPRRDRPDAR